MKKRKLLQEEEIEFGEVKLLIDKFSKTIDEHAKQINDESKSIIEELNAKLASWQNKERASQDRIQEIRKEIEAAGGKLDLAFIQKITKDASDYQGKLNQLLSRSRTLEEEKKKRAILIGERLSIRTKKYTINVSAFVTRVNQNLKATISDFDITH